MQVNCQAVEWQQLVNEDYVYHNAPMRDHTTFQIGGPADVLIEPSNETELFAVLQKATQMEIPVTVLGLGANLLVRDGGIRGLVVKIGKRLSEIVVHNNTIVAGAGAKMGAVSRLAAEHGLSGLEFAVGIPGTIGGGITMNAGAYSGELCQVVSHVRAVHPLYGIKEFQLADCQFGYRQSCFQKAEWVIIQVELTLCPGNCVDIQRRMEEFTHRRETTQPLDYPSAGSVFRRPPGFFTGPLIIEAGMQGERVGDAQVSTKHAGFIVNLGKATAGDVLALIEKVRGAVHTKSGVWLEPEIRIIGLEGNANECL